MDNEWEKHKRTLAELYFAQRKSLDEIVKHMADNHNFHAKPCEYKKQFRLWDLSKNLKAEHWKVIDLKVKKRKREGKQSDIYIHGIKLPRQKISKQISQQGIFSAAEMYRRAQCLDVPSWLLIRTPSPTPPLSPFLGQPEKPQASCSHIKESMSSLLITNREKNCLNLLRSALIARIFNCLDGLVEFLRTRLDGISHGIENVPTRKPLIVSPIESADSAPIPLRQWDNSWLELSRRYPASGWKWRRETNTLLFAIRRVHLNNTFLLDTLLICSLIRLGEDRCFRKFSFEFDLVQLALSVWKETYFLEGFTAQGIYQSPAIQAAYDDVPKLQHLFLAGIATVCDIHENNMSSLIFVSAWVGAYDTTLLIIRLGLSIFDAHWGKYSTLWGVWIGFFDRLESKIYYPRTAASDFESCMNICQLVLEKDENEAEIEECIDFTENLGNVLHVPCQYDLSDLDLDVLEKVTRYMLRIGTEIEYRSEKGLTPLLYAAWSSAASSAYIRILIKYGANVFTTDNEGRGPLHIAIMIFSNERIYHTYSDDPRHILVANLGHKLDALIDAGCDPHASDNWGKTPSQYIQQGDIWECWSSVLVNAGKDICDEMPPFTHLPGNLHIHSIHEDEEDDNSGEIRQPNEESIHTDETGIQCPENKIALDVETPSQDSSGAVTNIDEDIEMFSYIDWSLTDSVGDMAVHF